MSEPYVKSLLKAMRVLDIFGYDDIHGNGFSLSELSRRTGLAPNTLCKILKTLQRAEYLSQTPDKRYHASHKLDLMRLLAFPKSNIHDQVGDIILQFSQATNTNVTFAVLSFGERKPVLTVQAEYGVVTRINETEYVYTTPTGRILVSFADSAQFQDILQCHGFPYDLWDNIHDVPMFAARRAEIRERGYCHIQGSNADILAVPVHDASGSLLGALGSEMVYSGGINCRPFPISWPNLLAGLQITADKIATLFDSKNQEKREQ
ncbi:MAG: IclR family transcriptional regulator [Christensenellales bacterium]|jgi:DNA-binding IclR family transcriptional regulator